MTQIIKLEKKDYPNVMDLFSELPFGWDVMLEGAKDVGFFAADDNLKPNVAMAFMGGCVMYGGDPEHPAAKDLVHCMQFQPDILPLPAAWANLIQREHGDVVQIMDRYHMPFASLDQQVLDSIDLEVVAGFELRPMDEELANRLQPELGEEYHLYHYSSIEDFVKRGCAFCITRGDEIVAAALAAIRAEDKIQIQINTKEKYRRQGMALKTGASLLKFCLENGIRADWDASNINSRDLALKLGYQECIPYQTLRILPEE